MGVYYVSINIDDANSLALWVTFVNSALPVFLKAMQLMVEVHRNMATTRTRCSSSYF